jgi:hypothetical protein
LIAVTCTIGYGLTAPSHLVLVEERRRRRRRKKKNKEASGQAQPL